MKYLPLSLLSVLSVLSVLIAVPATATTPFQPYRLQDITYFSGTPNTTAPLKIENIQLYELKKTNACGLYVIPVSTKRYPINGNEEFMIFAFDPNATEEPPMLGRLRTSTLPTQILPKCLPSGQLEEARTTNFKTSTGQVVFVGQPNIDIEVVYPGQLTRNIRFDSCGVGKFRHPYNLAKKLNVLPGSTTKYTLNGTVLLAGSMPLRNKPLLCSKGILYQPQ